MTTAIGVVLVILGCGLMCGLIAWGARGVEKGGPPCQGTCKAVRSASAFREELEHLINRHSKENGSNTPDYMLADFLCTCLVAFDATVRARDRWYGIAPRPGWSGPSDRLHPEPPAGGDMVRADVRPSGDRP